MQEAPAELPLLTIERLSCSFPGPDRKPRFQALDRVNMAIYPRQTLAVVGESGSGKSVTAMSTLQLIPQPPAAYESGRILWDLHGDGRPMNLLDHTDKQMRDVRGDQIAMIFQEPMTSLNPVYTIGEQILEAILLHQDVPRKDAVDIAAQALEDVGISDPRARLKDYPHNLSGGMRQRVMIAMALACQPKLLLADEPTTALDVTIQAQILELLRRLQEEKGMAIMLITHDLGVVAENADTVAVMYAGRVCEYGSVYDVFNTPLHPYTNELLKSMPKMGVTVDRLPTVQEGAGPPAHFPSGWEVQPHTLEARPAGGYGGPDAKLYEVRPNHLVLCTPAAGNTAEPAEPRLAFRRHEAKPDATPAEV